MAQATLPPLGKVMNTYYQDSQRTTNAGKMASIIAGFVQPGASGSSIEVSECFSLVKEPFQLNPGTPGEPKVNHNINMSRAIATLDGKIELYVLEVHGKIYVLYGRNSPLHVEYQRTLGTWSGRLKSIKDGFDQWTHNGDSSNWIELIPHELYSLCNWTQYVQIMKRFESVRSYLAQRGGSIPWSPDNVAAIWMQACYHEQDLHKMVTEMCEVLMEFQVYMETSGNNLLDAFLLMNDSIIFCDAMPEGVDFPGVHPTESNDKYAKWDVFMMEKAAKETAYVKRITYESITLLQAAPRDLLGYSFYRKVLRAMFLYNLSPKVMSLMKKINIRDNTAVHLQKFLKTEFNYCNDETRLNISAEFNGVFHDLVVID
jgi:hypothetical protein